MILLPVATATATDAAATNTAAAFPLVTASTTTAAATNCCCLPWLRPLPLPLLLLFPAAVFTAADEATAALLIPMLPLLSLLLPLPLHPPPLLLPRQTLLVLLVAVLLLFLLLLS